MANSTLVFPPTYRLTNSAGNPISGGYFLFFDAGTSTPKVVYSDADLTSSLGSQVFVGSSGFPVASEGSSTTVTVYTGTDSYKIQAYDASDVLVWSADNIAGAPNITAPEAASIFVPVTTTGSDFTLAADDKGKLFNCQSNTVTFPAAATLGDGWFVYIRNGGGSGQVTLSAASGIAYHGSSFTSLVLQIGEAIAVTCDGTAFRTFADVGPIRNGLAADSSPEVTDTLLMYDETANTLDKVTLANLFIVINGLTEDTTPDGSADFVVTYDASAAASKKVKPQSLAATQAQLEAATAITNFSTPGRQHFHPGHPKAGGNFNGSGTPAFRSDYGMGAITDNGAGDWTLALDTAFSDTNYWINGWARGSSGQDDCYLTGNNGDTKTASTFQVRVREGTGAALQDSTEVGISFWGDYA